MPETVLYAVLIIIIIAAFPVMLWLRREGDRSWAHHRQHAVRIRLGVVALQASGSFLAAAAAMRLCGEAIRASSDYEAALARLNATMRGDRP